MVSMNNRGVSTVIVLVAFGLLATAVLIFTQSTMMQERMLGRIDTAHKADQVLSETAASLQALDFQELFDYCEAKGAFGNIVQGECTTNGTFNVGLWPPNALHGDPPYGPEVMEILRDWNGNVSETGRVCVELAICRKKSADKVLEVTLRGNWMPPLSESGLASRALTFRRVRW